MLFVAYALIFIEYQTFLNRQSYMDISILLHDCLSIYVIFPVDFIVLTIERSPTAR